MSTVRGRGSDLPTAPPTNDVYTGMLGISLAALLLGCIFLYFDYAQYPSTQKPTIPAPKLPTRGGDVAAPVNPGLPGGLPPTPVPGGAPGGPAPAGAGMMGGVPGGAQPKVP